MSAPAAALRAAGRVLATAGVAAGAVRRLRRLDPDARPDDRALCLRDAARRVLGSHRIEVRVAGPLPEGPALLASNHVSWIDPLVVASVLACVPVSKGEVGAWPVVGPLAAALGVLFVARGDAASGVAVMRAARRILEDGLPVLNFPEGTTTAGTDVREFHRGLFAVARRAGAPVVPVALAYEPAHLSWTGDQSFLPHWLRVAALPRARVTVRFGAPLSPRALDGAAGLADAARARVVDLLGA